MCVAADVTALFVLRGHGWARWTLIALSVLAGLASAAFGSYVAPLAVTAAALAVVVLLTRREARRWCRGRAADTLVG